MNSDFENVPPSRPLAVLEPRRRPVIASQPVFERRPLREAVAELFPSQLLYCGRGIHCEAMESVFGYGLGLNRLSLNRRFLVLLNELQAGDLSKFVTWPGGAFNTVVLMAFPLIPVSGKELHRHLKSLMPKTTSCAKDSPMRQFFRFVQPWRIVGVVLCGSGEFIDNPHYIG